MQLSKTFTNDLSKYHVILAGNLSEALGDYTKNVLYSIIFMLTNETSFGILGKEINGTSYLQVTLRNKKRFDIRVELKHIIVNLDGIQYTFSHYLSFNKVGIHLENILYHEKDKEILEDFKPHLVTISIRIQNKLFQFQIPMDTEYVLPTEYFKSIKFDSEILKLRRIYVNSLFPYQNAYNLEKEDTILNVYQMEEGYTLRDQVVLRNGDVILYQFNNKLGDVMINVTRKEGEETLTSITGLTPNFGVDLNEEVRRLVKRGETLFRKDRFKIVK